MGQILETNFDDDQDGGGDAAPSAVGYPETSSLVDANKTGHSRSLGDSGLLQLSLGAQPLETDM